MGGYHQIIFGGEMKNPQKQPDQNQMQRVEKSISEFSSSAASLSTEADRARSIFGFGRRILVPPDEIHVVTGDGRHSWIVSSERRVYGQTADRLALLAQRIDASYQAQDRQLYRAYSRH